jgi:2-phosphosulfolactate phosphatase
VSAGLRFDWALAGARAAQAEAAEAGAGALVVVDVLSFSTATTIATGRGTVVYPHPWPSPDVESFAVAHDAAWAVSRRQVNERQPWSLSPAQLTAAPAAERLVLPSPNGSAISAASTGCVVAGCLRNATAVARWLANSGYGTADKPVTVIAAGERWPGGELRPALEDLLGAAAVIAGFGPGHSRSPEAAAAEAVWRVHEHQATEFLMDCVTGRVLTGRGFTADVALAAEHDVQTTVPVLTDGAFRSVGSGVWPARSRQ